MQRDFLALMGVIVIAAAFGCGKNIAAGTGDTGEVDDGGLDGGGTGRDGGGSCTRDAECKAPTPKCVQSSGACVACLQTTDCAEKETCIGNACKPGTIICKVDKDCDGMKCDTGNGKCVECVADRDCKTNYVCQNGSCKPSTGSPCGADSDCDLGELCIDKTCVPGCRTDRDCPNNLQCDPAHGAHGGCVECLSKEDCTGGFQCADGKCQFFCTTDADCPGRHCEPTSKQCVDCLATDNCPLGNICDQTKKCVPGCTSTRDCQTPLKCDAAAKPNGKCVECLADADCGSGNKTCTGGTCVTKCASDADCGGLKCNTGSGLCVECLATDDCQLGNICNTSNNCVPGCASTRDCPSPLKCEPSLGSNGACVQCLADADCGAGAKCVSNNCQQTCTSDANCTAGHCDTPSGKCVECLEDAHCALGTICISESCTPGCNDTPDCPQPKKCNTSTSPGQCVDCMTNTDCATNGTCTAGKCIYPGKQCGEACTFGSTDCAQGLTCGYFLQQCLPICTTAAECPDSQCLVFGGTSGVCMVCPPPTCDPPCASNEECQDGTCIKKCFPPCDFGFACDNGACTAVASDCTTACTPGTFCYAKTCTPVVTGSCPAGMIYLQDPPVCNDRFEASLKDGSVGNADGTDVTATAASMAGALPLASVTYYQANQICKNSGKRLCTAPEWQAACQGPDQNVYPYGATYVAGVCNSDGINNGTLNTGSSIGCISQTGVVDMSGNVWEWTDTQYSATTDRKILGGGYTSTDVNSACTSDLNFLKDDTYPNGLSAPLPLTEVRDTLGFRCCLTK